MEFVQFHFHAALNRHWLKSSQLKCVPQISSLSEAIVKHLGHMTTCDFLEAVQVFVVYFHKPK